MKRPFDFVLASIALLITLPLWLILAAAIRWEDGGPVFYRQRRWGRGGKPIRVLKFRTMIVDAGQQSVQAVENDPRITKVGRWLRRTSLDEMPQILSILKGDMSWVGPRPLAMNELLSNEKSGTLPDAAVPGFYARCSVRPGLTGVAQVYGSRDLPRRHKFRYDRFYIRNQSLLLDIKLIALSLWITIRARWEKRGKKVWTEANGRDTMPACEDDGLFRFRGPMNR